jgi:ubiquinone/menaquinone biosynthesis C-methylase UbiE
MFQRTLEQIVTNYAHLVETHGDSPASGQWDNTSQDFRFAQLIRIANLEGKHVLDFGCGIGDLLDYLHKHNIDCTYTGIDIVQPAIALAKTKFKDFECLNIFEEPVHKSFDFALLSGVFNNATPDADLYMREILQRVFSMTRLGVAFNFISDRVNFRDEDMAYHDPTEVLKFCIDSLSRKTVLHHHYERCDVSVFVYV